MKAEDTGKKTVLHSSPFMRKVGHLDSSALWGLSVWRRPVHDLFCHLWAELACHSVSIDAGQYVPSSPLLDKMSGNMRASREAAKSSITR